MGKVRPYVLERPWLYAAVRICERADGALCWGSCWRPAVWASVQSRDNLAVKALKAVAKFFCTAYGEVFRATPMLVQVFIIYYGLGNVFKLPDSSLNRMFWGMVAVGLNSAAYMSEVIRSGIGAVPGGRWRPRAASA